MEELKKLKNFFITSFDIKTQILIRVAIIGVVIGFVAVGFRLAIEKLSHLLYEDYYTKEYWYEWLYLPLICMTGGLVASYLTQKFAPDAAGSGIPQVKHALSESGVVIRLRTVVVKFFAGIIGIASGLSLGREGPTIQIGAGLGSKISKLLGGKHRKRAIASGAGAGLAAAFNTPIAGVLFVIEELDKNFSSVSLGPAIVCSVSAAVTCRVLYGNFFTLPFVTDSINLLSSMPFYLFLGVICAIFGTYFQRSVLASLDVYNKLFQSIPKWTWGAIAGLLTGIVGLFLPQAIGAGHDTLEGVLAQGFQWYLLPLIFAVKYLVTVIAYGSGVPGGIFAPSLILGALLGATLGNFIDFAGFDVNTASFAFVGMGAFFTAVSRAPITSIVMMLEITGNYDLVLPLMFSCILANIGAERLKQGSIYENLLEKAGINIKEYSRPSYLQRFAVEDAMTRKVDTITEDLTLKELQAVFDHSHHSGFPVLDAQGNLTGIITTHDMHEAYDNQLNESTLASDLMARDLQVVHSNDNLHTAILKFYEFKIGRLLVVADDNPSKLVGIITRSDIINFEANKELDY